MLPPYLQERWIKHCRHSKIKYIFSTVDASSTPAVSIERKISSYTTPGEVPPGEDDDKKEEEADGKKVEADADEDEDLDEAVVSAEEKKVRCAIVASISSCIRVR